MRRLCRKVKVQSAPTNVSQSMYEYEMTMERVFGEVKSVNNVEVCPNVSIKNKGVGTLRTFNTRHVDWAKVG